MSLLIEVLKKAEKEKKQLPVALGLPGLRDISTSLCTVEKDPLFSTLEPQIPVVIPIALSLTAIDHPTADHVVPTTATKPFSAEQDTRVFNPSVESTVPNQPLEEKATKKAESNAASVINMQENLKNKLDQQKAAAYNVIRAKIKHKKLQFWLLLLGLGIATLSLTLLIYGYTMDSNTITPKIMPVTVKPEDLKTITFHHEVAKNTQLEHTPDEATMTPPSLPKHEQTTVPAQQTVQIKNEITPISTVTKPVKSTQRVVSDEHTTNKPFSANSHETAAAGIALQRAYVLYQNGQYAQAKLHYDELLQTRPLNSDALLGLAAIAIAEKHYDIAYENYIKILKNDSRNAYAIAGLVEILGHSNQEKSESQLKQLLQQHNPPAFIYFTLGNLYAKTARWNEAHWAFFQSYAQEKYNPVYLFNLAVANDRLGKTADALKYYQETLQATEKHQNALINTAAILERMDALNEQNILP